MWWGFVPLLADNVPVVLHFCEPRQLPVDVLPASFSVLHCSLPSQNGFLLLPKPLNLLLDSGQFLFLCCYFFFSFLIPIIDLDMTKLRVS
jgi:hypothetical protein